MSPQFVTVVVAILGIVAPVVRSFVLAHVTPTRLAHVTDIARMAVDAAEKLGSATGATGSQKLAYASDIVASGAKRLGFKLSTNEVYGFVHAALAEVQRLDAAATH